MSYKRPRAVFENDNSQDTQSPFVVYGTALPPEDPDSRDDGSYVPLWKQEVRDERGRKRLHGAFTGGFSAGYFNSVGSKEGWTPSNFVSSRRDRAKDGKAQPQQRPEDFMDEEDVRETEEAKILQTANDFTGFGSTSTDPVRAGGLMDILRTAGETAGVRLLKRMGWKEGQGIGPKVRRRADLDEAGDGNGETYLFAPGISPMISLVKKSDYKGLGFEGEARLETSSANKQQGLSDQDDDFDGENGPKLSLKGRKPQVSQQQKRGGFGVGVLNDTGSDDEDPYEIGPNISYSRVIQGSKKSGGKPIRGDGPKPAIRSSNPLLHSKPVFISKKTSAGKGKSGFRKCHDGRLPLEGFLLSVQLDVSAQNKRYEPPPIPEGWKSAKAPSTSKDTSNYVSTADAAKASNLDPKSRAALLGESQLPGKSVFDFMTPEARDRIAKATGRADLPPALSEKAPKGFEVSESQKRKDLWDLVPKLDKDVALQALNRGVAGWMPYAEDESKRGRYRSFLEVRAGISDRLPERIAGITTDEWATELSEFSRAAEVFKPISGLMASRFTSSSTSHLPPGSDNQQPNNPSGSFLRKPETKPENPADAAAKVGMYGPMTRTSHPFHPARLLCKRFNTRAPANTVGRDAAPGGPSEMSGFENAPEPTPELVSKETMNQLLMESARNGGRSFPPSDNVPSQQQQQQPPLDQPPSVQQQTVVDPDHNEALEANRPGEEVFKAIFGSDDEDDG